MKQQYYSYRQGTAHYRAPLRIVDSGSGCVGSLLAAAAYVAATTATFLLVYWGYKLLVAPIIINAWEQLTHALGG